MPIAHGTTMLVLGIACGLLAGCGGTARPPIGQPPPVDAQSPSPDRAAASGARVTGQVTTPDSQPLVGAAVIMAPARLDDEWEAPQLDAAIQPDGRFEFRRVTPGRYLIRARGETAAGAPLFATFTLQVQARDVDGIVMALLPGATLSGTLVAEPVRAAPLRDFAGARVRAAPAGQAGFGDVTAEDIARDGSFTLEGLMAGVHVVRVDGLRPPWVLKQVTLGERDVTDSGIDAAAGQRRGGVRVTITDVASELSGIVRDADGRPAPEALVVVLPPEREHWTRTSRRFAAVRADAQGRYRVRGLPAGEYRAAASLALDDSALSDTRLLRTFADTGVSFSLAGTEARVLDLPLTGGSGAGDAAGR